MRRTGGARASSGPDQASGAGGSARLRGAALATSKTLQKDLFGSFCFKFELHKKPDETLLKRLVRMVRVQAAYSRFSPGFHPYYPWIVPSREHRICNLSSDSGCCSWQAAWLSAEQGLKLHHHECRAQGARPDEH